MQLANENLLEVFLFLARSDLDLLHFVNKQLGKLIDDALTHACLRLIEHASIRFSHERQAFEAKAEIVQWREDDGCCVESGSSEDALKHLLQLTCAAHVESLWLSDLDQLDDSFLSYPKTWRGALHTRELYIAGCDMSSADEGFLQQLVRR
ncbi:hypothetical protein AAVH_33199 [Aphelenchoides avenae]|nr:hypothetical protein AAVH_33199 [Aphelenchus avenae]